MTKIIDLSHDINNDTYPYPGDDKIVIKEKNSYLNDGYTIHTVSTNMHIGTHLDVPMHISADSRYVSDFELNMFYGKASIIDASNQSIIDWKSDYDECIKEDILLIYTGFDKHYQQPAYYQKHPVLTMKFAEQVILKKIKLLVLDIPSPDYFPYNVHRLLFEHDICIVENAKDLHYLLNKEFIFQGFPLKIKAEASLIRAVAMIL